MDRKTRTMLSAACCLGGILLFPAKVGGQAPVLQIVRASKLGTQLLDHWRTGSLTFTNPGREGAQLRKIAKFGFIVDERGRAVAVAVSLLRTLDELCAKSTRSKPLELMSLFRPARSVASSEPHANGLAADIAAFGGYRIDARSPERCVKGVIAIIDTLGPGEYRLGLPKPPNTDPISLLPPPHRPKVWAFFPAPLPYFLRLMGLEVVLPRPWDALRASSGKLRPWILRWENERGAPIEEIGDRRVRLAIRRAVTRGANPYSLFPDALDHLHVDVRPLRSSTQTKTGR